MRTERERQSLQLVIDAFTNLYGYTCKITENDMCHWDIELTGRTEGVIEVKERDLIPDKLLKYKDGLYLEAYKYNHLKNKKSIYSNYFNYNNIKLIFCWNINEIKGHTSDEMMTDTQDFGVGEKVSKSVYKLSINDCSIILLKYKNEDWKRISPTKAINQIKNAIDNMLLK